MTLSKESMSVVQDAGKTIASEWQSGFESSSGRKYTKRKRTFRSVAKVWRRKMGEAKDDANAGVKKTIAKKLGRPSCSRQMPRGPRMWLRTTPDLSEDTG